MQKIALTVSITLVTLAVLLVGFTNTSSNFVKRIMSQVQPMQEEKTVIFDDFEDKFDKESLPHGSSAVILGDTSKLDPTPKQVIQQNYQQQLPLPTATLTQEPIVQQPQEYKTPWDGYANKEAFCKDIADRVMQQPPPEIDQSNLPPELRVSLNYEAGWRSSYQSCMDQIRDY